MALDIFTHHLEDIVRIKSTPEEIFAFADDHHNFASHMNESSWMMGGSKMLTTTDEANGQSIGSHIKMKGKVLGMSLYLDEVISEREPPLKKTWNTIGDIRLIVIDHYRLGFEIIPHGDMCDFKVFIDYNLPQSFVGTVIGNIFGGIYARWCLKQMTSEVAKRFSK